MPSVLFVCTGNICRSPMAGALFASKLGPRSGTIGWEVRTAGTWATEGMPASRHAQTVMAEWGLDISAHRSRRVTRQLVETADLILTMEKGHKEALRTEFPGAAHRVYLLSEMAGFQSNVEDPLGEPLAAYEATAREIDQLILQGFKEILQLAERPEES